MKRILITGAGGSAATNFVRSLRQAPEVFYLIGVDCNKYYLQRAETDKKYLIPRADEEDHIPILKEIINETRPDFLYSQPDQEIFKSSKYRDELKVRLFLPCHKTIEICHDMYESYKRWKKAGLKVPETMLIKNEKDLVNAFQIFGRPLWIRAIVSPGAGKGSFRAENIKMAKAWINFCNGWGNFSAAECLESQSITWLSIWKDGKLVVAQGRKRLYWEFANRVPSGITGLTGTGVTISDKVLDGIAQKAILSIDKKPNGIFGVDLTYDKDGIPNPTEINIGRFFTTHLFFTEAGLNMPYIFIELAFNEKLPSLPKKINPLPPGLAWVRGMDFFPILTDIKKINLYEEELRRRREKL